MPGTDKKISGTIGTNQKDVEAQQEPTYENASSENDLLVFLEHRASNPNFATTPLGKFFTQTVAKLSLNEAQSLRGDEQPSTPLKPGDHAIRFDETTAAQEGFTAPISGTPLNPFAPRSPWTGQAPNSWQSQTPFPYAAIRDGPYQMPVQQMTYSFPAGNTFTPATHQYVPGRSPPSPPRELSGDGKMSTIQKELFTNEIADIPRLSVQSSTPSRTVISFFCQLRKIKATYNMSDADSCSLLVNKLAKDEATDPWLNKLSYSGFPSSIEEWEGVIAKKCHLMSSIQASTSELLGLTQGKLTYNAYYTKYIMMMQNSFVDDSVERGLHFVNSLAAKEMTMLQNDYRWLSLARSPALSVDACNDILAELLQTEATRKAALARNQPQDGDRRDQKGGSGGNRDTLGRGGGYSANQPVIKSSVKVVKASHAAIRRTVRALSEGERSRRFRENKCLFCNTVGCRQTKHMDRGTEDAGSVSEPMEATVRSVKAKASHQSVETDEEEDRYRRARQDSTNSPPAVVPVRVAPFKNKATGVVSGTIHKTAPLTSMSSATAAPVANHCTSVVAPSLATPSLSLNNTGNVEVPLVDQKFASIYKLLSELPHKRPRTAVIFKAWSGVPHRSTQEMSTMALFKNASGRFKSTPTLADTGAQVNCMSPELAEKLGLEIHNLTEPIVATFANQAEEELDSYVITEIKIGKTYLGKVQFVLCPVGDQVILGMPWWASIKAILEIGTNKFSFQRLIPGTRECYPEVHQFPLLSVQEVLGTKKPQTSLIQTVNAKTALRITRNRKTKFVYAIDIKEITRGQQDIGKTEQTPEEWLTTTEQNEDVKQLVAEFRDRFRPPTTLPPARPEDLKIDLISGASPPKVFGLGRMNEAERVQLQATLKTQLERKQIRVSSSPYASRVLFVKKPDGSLRLCVDYRALNAITIRNRCPIPNISDLRSQIRGMKYCTKFDLRDGYYNIRMHPDSIEKTAFKCAFGLFEYTVLPFGLTNAPAVFSQMMNRIFGDLFGICVIAYLDDIVVFSKTRKQHVLDVKTVLERMASNSLHIKLKKCYFFQREVEFCGHNVNGTGVSIAESKTTAMEATPVITCKRDIEKFLGVTIWFQDFIRNYAQTLVPVTNLLKKKVRFYWGEKQQQAVESIINAIVSAPVLRHFDPDLPTRCHSDASQYAIAGWLEQRHQDGWHPVVFVSRKLTAAELNYSNPERELLALLYTLEKQGHYLRSGIPFVSNVDCESLKYIQSMDVLNRRVARWIMFLQDFNITVKHIDGKLNTVADYLSRNLEVAPTCHLCKKQMKIHAITSTTLASTEFATLYTTAAAEDPILTEVVKWKKDRRNRREASLYQQFQQMGGKWYLNKRIYVPSNEELKLMILKRYHDAATAGHQGIRRTRAKVAESYYWPNMDTDIRRYVGTCLTCQRNSERHSHSPGLLHPLPVPVDRFRDIAIDFANIPATTNGFNQLMVVVCRLTKLCKLILSKSTDSTKKIAERFVDGWYSCGYGLPQSITSDRDSKFTSTFWDSLSQSLGISLERSTARHQQTNGQAEIAIRTYKRTARKYSSIVGEDWVHTIHLLEFALNNSVSASTGFTPFFLAFGFQPRCFPEEYERLAAIQNAEAESLLETVEDSLAKAQDAIRQSQLLQKEQYDKHHSDGPKFNVNDLVLLSSDGINWPSLAHLPEAMRPLHLGPLKIVAVDKDRENYTLEFPAFMQKSRFHPTFHVSRLKPFKSRATVFPTWRDTFERPGPVKVSETGEDLYEVNRVLGHRILGGGKRWEFTLGFKGYPDSHGQPFSFTMGQAQSWKDEKELLLAYIGRCNDPRLDPVRTTLETLRPTILSNRQSRTTRQSTSKRVSFDAAVTASFEPRRSLRNQATVSE